MKKSDWIIYIAFFLLFIASIFIETKTQWINNAILIITAIILLWYTRETEDMKREVAKQNFLQTRPILILEFNNSKVYLKNEGRGPALNGIVEKFKTRFFERDKYNETKSDYQFAPFAFIPVDKSHELIMMKKDDEGGKYGTMSEPDVFFQLEYNIFITVAYEDIEGTKYVSSLEVQSGAIEKISFERS